MIEASPFDTGAAYAAVDRHRLDDMNPYIYMTTDYGEHWTRADNGIPSGSYVHVIRSDLRTRGLLYAGTETGVYVSFDDGTNWQPLQLNLPVVSVHDLAVHGNDLVAATHGRAFWVLDDLTPLQQMTKNVLDSDVHLFKPEPAVRIRRSENTDTPLPPEEPQGTNPPAGAIIDYYFKSTPRGPISLEIVDASGNVVRKYSSLSEKMPGPIPQVIADYWLQEPEQLGTNAGHNRFVWDLHYTPPPVHNYDYGMSVANLQSVREPQGPLVLPGKYEVRLSYEMKTYSQPLEIAMDPRVKISGEALKEQLELSIEVWNTISDANSLLSTLDTLGKELDEIRSETAADSGLLSRAASLVGKISALKDSLAIDDMSGLEVDLARADREPTQEMKDACRAIETNLSRTENEWKRIETGEMSELNKELRSAGMTEIEISNEPAVDLAVPWNR